ncbi:hypothetical protein BV22DRAFT_683725 [Leucogyrophana mollusca]|uniref:Uncharacterized protein n=1 Tax=Leucogyrophana mollusca TaxID=85980 RepID=A0ACB8B917_9AGAM|nr:hypothetical protein BV22DRAFT_683725 [Leucogyrophana mollusca]
MNLFRGIDVVTASSASALSFLVWESCTTLDDEVEYIWSKSYTSPIKWLYLFTRYIGLGDLVATPYFGYRSALSCRGWIVLQMGGLQAMVTLVEMILMLRVHALYNRDPRMRAFLILLILVATVIPATGMGLSASKTMFSPSCAVMHIDNPLTFISYIYSITESILLILTVVKCVHTSRTTLRHAPVIVLMLRDGMLAFFALVGRSLV